MSSSSSIPEQPMTRSQTPMSPHNSTFLISQRALLQLFHNLEIFSDTFTKLLAAWYSVVGLSKQGTVPWRSGEAYSRRQQGAKWDPKTGSGHTVLWGAIADLKSTEDWKGLAGGTAASSPAQLSSGNGTTKVERSTGPRLHIPQGHSAQ